jgi:hypothetical protein
VSSSSDDIQEEVSKALQLATEAWRGADRSTTVGRSEGRGGRGSGGADECCRDKEDPVRIGVVCRRLSGWGLTSATFGATLSWFRLERERRGRRGDEPVPRVRWESAGGVEGVEPGTYDAVIFFFKEKVKRRGISYC